jgi:hypothetical protein
MLARPKMQGSGSSDCSDVDARVFHSGRHVGGLGAGRVVGILFFVSRAQATIHFPAQREKFVQGGDTGRVRRASFSFSDKSSSNWSL